MPKQNKRKSADYSSEPRRRFLGIEGQGDMPIRSGGEAITTYTIGASLTPPAWTTRVTKSKTARNPTGING